MIEDRFDRPQAPPASGGPLCPLRVRVGPDLEGELLTATLNSVYVRLDGGSTLAAGQEVTAVVASDALPSALALDGTVGSREDPPGLGERSLHRICLDQSQSGSEALHSLLDHYHGSRLREGAGHLDLIGVDPVEAEPLHHSAWAIDLHRDVADFLQRHHWQGYGCLVLTDESARSAGSDFYRLLRAMGDDHVMVVLTRGDNPLVPAELAGQDVFHLRAGWNVGEAHEMMAQAIEAARQRLRTLRMSALAEVRIGSLSRREREVLEHILQGLSSKEISAAMEISKRTVDNHRVAIMRKLAAHSIAELIVMAMASYTYGAGRVPQPWADPSVREGVR